MLKCTSLLLAESVTVDAATGYLSLVNLIERLSFNQFPAAISKSILVAQFVADTDEDKSSKIQITLLLNGKIISMGDFDLPNGALQSRLRIMVNGISLPESGTLRFEVRAVGSPDTILAFLNIPVINTAEGAMKEQPKNNSLSQADRSSPQQFDPTPKTKI